jgi:hypothetical protein
MKDKLNCDHDSSYSSQKENFQPFQTGPVIQEPDSPPDSGDCQRKNSGAFVHGARMGRLQRQLSVDFDQKASIDGERNPVSEKRESESVQGPRNFGLQVGSTDADDDGYVSSPSSQHTKSQGEENVAETVQDDSGEGLDLNHASGASGGLNGSNKFTSNSLQGYESDSDYEWARLTAKAIKTMQSKVSGTQNGHHSMDTVNPRLVCPFENTAQLNRVKGLSNASSSTSLSSDTPSDNLSDSEEILNSGVFDTPTSDYDSGQSSGINFVAGASSGNQLTAIRNRNGNSGGAGSFDQSSRIDGTFEDSDSEEESEETVDKNLYRRFYHVFCKGELDDLVEESVDSLHVLESYYDHANWALVAEKVQVWKI